MVEIKRIKQKIFLFFLDKKHRKFNQLVKRPTCFFHFVGWHCLSFGFHIDLILPYIELHLPFGFIRFGLDWKVPKEVIRILNKEAEHYEMPSVQKQED